MCGAFLFSFPQKIQSNILLEEDFLLFVAFTLGMIRKQKK